MVAGSIGAGGFTFGGPGGFTFGGPAPAPPCGNALAPSGDVSVGATQDNESAAGFPINPLGGPASASSSTANGTAFCFPPATDSSTEAHGSPDSKPNTNK